MQTEFKIYDVGVQLITESIMVASQKVKKR